MAEKTVPATQNNESQVVKREITRQPETYVTPLTDIYEENGGLYVLVDLPGVEKTGLKLSVENEILTIEGHITSTTDSGYLMREFEPADYFRQFELSESVDRDNINAELKNGVLSIYLPNADKPKNIEVKVH